MFNAKVSGSLETIDGFLRKIVEIGDDPQYYDRVHIEKAGQKNIEGKDNNHELIRLLIHLISKEDEAKDTIYRTQVQRQVVYNLTKEVKESYDKELKKRKWNKRLPVFIGWYNSFADRVTRVFKVALSSPLPQRFENINVSNKKYSELVGPLGESKMEVNYHWDFFKEVDSLICSLKIETNKFNQEGLKKLEATVEAYK